MRVKVANATAASTLLADIKEKLPNRTFHNYTFYNASAGDDVYLHVEQDFIDNAVANSWPTAVTESAAIADGMTTVVANVTQDIIGLLGQSNMLLMATDATFETTYRASLGEHRKARMIWNATGSTGFSSNNWNIGDTLYETGITNINAAIVENSGNVFKGICWHQGEQDSTWTETQYANAIDAIIPDLRNRIIGGTNARFVVGGLLKTAPGVNAALKDTPNRHSNVGYVSAEGLVSNGDGTHLDSASQKLFGERYFETFL